MDLKPYVHPPREESVSPQSYGAPALKPCWPSMPNALGAPPLDARPTDWGNWHGVWNSHSCGRPQQYSYFPVFDLHTQKLWDLLTSWKCLFYCLIVASLFLGIEYLFSVFQLFLIDGCSELNCDFWCFHEKKCAWVLVLCHFVSNNLISIL